MKKLFHISLDAVLVLAILFFCSVFILKLLGESGDLQEMFAAVSYFFFFAYGVLQGAVRGFELAQKKKR